MPATPSNRRTAAGHDLEPACEASTSPQTEHHSTAEIHIQSMRNRDGQNSEAPERSRSRSFWAILKQLWKKLDLDLHTLKMMFKSSLPSAIALAIFQSHAVSSHFGTLGFLMPIAGLLSMNIMPRGKFIQTILLDILSACGATAVNLLALYCSTKARQNTTAPGDEQRYNSSASAVCAIWLIVQMYVCGVIKAKGPQFVFPTIVAQIFAIVALTYGTVFPDMAYAIHFMVILLEVFLSGFALAIGVHFLVFPVSSREILFKGMTAYLKLLGSTLDAITHNLDSLSLELPDCCRASDGEDECSAQTYLQQLGQLTKLTSQLLALHEKLHADISVAKREVALGKLDGSHLKEIWKHVRGIMLPIVALGQMLDRKIAVENLTQQWVTSATHADSSRGQPDRGLLQGPSFCGIAEEFNGAVDHILLILELEKAPKHEGVLDEESKGKDVVGHGAAAFVGRYQAAVDQIYSRRKRLQERCIAYGTQLPEGDDVDPVVANFAGKLKEDPKNRQQRKLFMILYVEYLLWRVSKSMLDFVLYVEEIKQAGALSKTKIHFPGSKQMYKWMQALSSGNNMHEDYPYASELAPGSLQPYLSEGFSNKDPEHLPARNALEKAGNIVRAIPEFFRTPESAFGLRCAAAAMTVAVVCYLKDTQAWFIQQRGDWSLILIALAMTRTSGQHLFNLFCRLCGTILGMIGAYIIWYIVDGKTAGVIVFAWLWMFLTSYVFVKKPKYLLFGLLAFFTAMLIVTYELQVRVLGYQLATSNTQPAYPTYRLAPYRLVAYIIGLLVTFIWSVFPYPISEGTELRRDVAAALHSLGYYFETVQETLRARARGSNIENERIKGSHAHQLEKARSKTFSRLTQLMSQMRSNSNFSRFQVHLGGSFPKQQYTALIEYIQRLLIWTSLVSYTSVTFAATNAKERETSWSSDFRKLISDADSTANGITLLLSLLSASLSSGQPLPRFLEMPQPFQLTKNMQDFDRDILSPRHIAEPEYSAFAGLQIVTNVVSNDVLQVTEIVRSLVGQMDFSFHSEQAKSGPVAVPESSASDLHR